jgi:regulator of replication initiation timing
LSQRVGELEVEKAKLMQEFGRIRAENESLIAENKRLSIAVRQYMLQQNPNLLKP